MIRHGKRTDIKELTDFTLEWATLYPYLRPDRDKIKRAFREIIFYPATNFCLVATDEDRIRGALIAMQLPNLWAAKNFCSIIFWHSQIAGDGVKMLRMFKQWVDTRSVIRVAGFHPDIELNPRVLTLAERVGFRQHGGAYLYYKGEQYGLV